MKVQINRIISAIEVCTNTPMPIPHFIIAGERRSGTTSLAGILNQHPDIFLHPRQDKRWFIDDTVRSGNSNISEWEVSHDLEDYSRWFADGGAGDHPVIGEKSADYLYWKPAHERIARLLPSVKLIITLRNPVHRAWSHYWNEVAKKRDTLSFEEAIETEEERIRFSPRNHYNLSYLSRGDYADSLRHLFQHIPRNRVLIVTLEKIIVSPSDVLHEICSFIGANPQFAFEVQRGNRNVNWAVVPRPWAEKKGMRGIANIYGKISDTAVKLVIHDRNKRRAALARARAPFFVPAGNVRMSMEVENYLKDYFRQKKHELETLLGRKFPEWNL